MSQNNKIRKSDKKFIRLEKARIRAAVLDVKKTGRVNISVISKIFR
jgi:hypothetical protein